MVLKNFAIPIPDGLLYYIPEFIDQRSANLYLEIFKTTIEWKQEHLNMYGKQIPFPRLTAWYANEGLNYKYSGITNQPKALTKELQNLKLKIEDITDIQFNSVLLNYYREGSDSMSWHADNEIELGSNPIIASFSLGATRKFKLKHNQTKQVINLELENGSLLLMAGSLQHHWKHAIPKTKKTISERINLTFRHIY